MKKRKNNRDKLRIVYCALSVGVCLGMIAVLLVTVSWMPAFGRDDNPAENEVYERYVSSGTGEAGAVNTVADMILDYRAFDTLGESNVLFTAACIVMILLRADRDPKDGRYLIPQLQPEETQQGSDPVLRGAAVFLVPLGALFGIAMIMNGHLSAGGGFSGGAVIGASLILYAAAFGPEPLERYLNMKTWSRMVWAALMIYTLLKTYSFYTGANGLESIVPLGEPGRILSGGLILPLNICVGIVVTCTIYGFFALFRKGGFSHGR